MRTLDDRANMVRINDALPRAIAWRTVLNHSVGDGDDVDAARTRRAARALAVEVVIALLIYAALIALTWPRTPGPSGAWSTALIVLVIAGAPIPLSFWFLLRLGRRLNTHEPRDRGVCPACAHDLRALAPESDGCVICPECGAAWRSAAPPTDVTT